MTQASKNVSVKSTLGAIFSGVIVKLMKKTVLILLSTQILNLSAGQKTGISEVQDFKIKARFPFEKKAEIFEFDNSKDFLIETKAKAKFHILAGSFADSAGPVAGLVRVRIIIFIQKLDFLNIPVELRYGQNFLESAGMFSIDAESQNKPVRLKNKIKVEFPNLYPGKDFYVYHSDGSQWKLHGHNQEKVSPNRERREIRFSSGGMVSGFRQREYFACDPSRPRKISGTVRYEDGELAKGFAFVNEITCEKIETDDNGKYEITIPGGCEIELSKSEMVIAGIFKIIGKNESPNTIDIKIRRRTKYIGLREATQTIGIREYMIDKLGLWNFDKVNTAVTCITGKLPDASIPTNLYSIALKKNLFAFLASVNDPFKISAFPGENHLLIGYSNPDINGDFNLYTFKRVAVPLENNDKCINAEFDATIKMNANSTNGLSEILKITGLNEVPYHLSK